MALRSRRGLVVLALLASLLVLPGAPAVAQGDDNVSIIKDSEAPSNAEIATRLSEETDFAGTVGRVVISRDDNFADALASGLLQREAPLLLVPSQGPVPERVMAEIQRLGADRATILGGTGAVAAAVETQLSGRGIAVDRRAGGSRIETAIEIAHLDAPDATTAIIARAFPSNPEDPTQGFADALGAGAMAAERGWPILLSDTGALSGATRAYLADSDITQVKLIGGTAALSADVETAINGMGIATERLAGPTRGATALEIGKELGAESAADVAHLILVDGTAPDGWAGGFAAAHRAAVLDAPILLADGVRLLPETEAFLEPGSTFAQAGDLTVTCVVHPLACTEGRRALGLVDYPLLSLDPPRGSRIDPGQRLTISLSPVEEGAGVEVFFDGTCLDEALQLTTDAAARVALNLATSFDGPQCQLTTTYASSGDEAFNRSTVTYVTEGPGARTAADAFVASEVLAFGSVVPDQPVIVNDTVSCTSPGAGAASIDGWAMQAQDQQPGAPAFDTVNIGSNPLTAAPDASCTITITPPPEASRVFWGLYSVYDISLRVPLLLGTGTSASFDLGRVAAETGADVRDVAVRWIVQVDTPTPSAPQPPPPGEHGVVNNPDGLDVVCGGDPVPAGQFILPVGTQCTAAVANPAFNVLLVQPDAANVSASSVSFTALADSRWTTVRAQLQYQDLAPGQGGDDCQAAMPLEIGRQTGGAITEPFEARYHRFDAQAGDAFRIRLSEAFPDGFDPLVTLIGPGGQVVGSNDDAEGTLNSRLDVTVPTSGTYCVEAAGFSSSTGDYFLAVDPAPDAAFADELTAAEPAHVYPLTGVAGERVILEMRDDGPGTDPLLEIYDAAGNLVASDDDGGGFPNARIEFDVPADGDYDVVATAFGASVGFYVLEASFIAPGGGFSGLAPR